jgi:biotin carboxylase
MLVNKVNKNMSKLAIIGASYLQLPLLLKAQEMGIETHCFAWEDGAVCKNIADFFYPISITDKESILEICKKVKIDGITSIASDVAVPTICYVAEQMGLVSNSYQDALIATNKYAMRQRFRECGVSSPFFSIADGAISDKKFHYPVIVKPVDRSGSRGVTKVINEVELKSAVERAKSESFLKQAIVEEFVSGGEVSVETISWEGKHYILTITDKVTTGEPYFVELEHHQPSQLLNNVQDKIKTETLKALDALNVKCGASHTELKITDNEEVFLIEVGARMGGDFIGSDLVYLSTGYDFLKGVLQIALGKFEEPVLGKQNYSGVYFLSEDTSNLKDIIEQASNYPEIVKSEITDAELRKITCSADRSGYFIYQSSQTFKI